MPDMLTRKEAAQRLGISEDTLDAERRKGRIAFIQRKKGGKVWFTENAIAEYIARITHPARPEPQIVNTYRKRRVGA